MPVLRIIVGSYERLLFGYVIDTISNQSEQQFAFGAHVGCIKAITVTPKSGGILITGGEDEIIKLFSLKALRSMDELFQHTATITQLDTYSTTHILSGDESGKIILWRTKDWEPLTTLKGHKSAIAGLTIHPSGKLALSVSVDRQLFCWNLLRGLKATKLRLPDIPFAIQFSPSGEKYVILYQHTVVVYETISTNIISTYDSPTTRLNAITFIDDTRFVIGCENGSVTLMKLININKQEDKEEQQLIQPILQFLRTDSNTRIRALSMVQFTSSDDDDVGDDNDNDNDDNCEDISSSSSSYPSIYEYYLAAASSKGTVAVWRVPDVDDQPHDQRDQNLIHTIKPIAEFDTKCRLTCISLSALDGELVTNTE